MDAQPFDRTLAGLQRRGALNRPVLQLQITAELLAAAIESAASMQSEAELSEVQVTLGQSSLHFRARVRVRGRAWPPRPPVDTQVELGLDGLTHTDAGEHGGVMFRVAQPLALASAFADVVLGLIGKIRGLPVRVDSLRHRDALVTIDFATLVRAWRPDLADRARRVRLYGLHVAPGSARIEIGFTE